MALILLLVILYLLYGVSLVLYRLWFSPIAAFPGPILARATFWYEFYYDYFKKGRYYLEVGKMHQKYGPVVRVTPNEIHVMDATFHPKLYVAGAVRRTNDYPRFGAGTGFEDLLALNETHEAHRRRRAPLDPFFSRAGVMHVESRVIERVQRLCHRIDAMKDSNEILNVKHAFAALATDVLSSIMFENSSDWLSMPDFNGTETDILKKGLSSIPLFAHLPWLLGLMATPIIRAITYRITGWHVWADKAKAEIRRSQLRPSQEAKTRAETTVFDHLVHSGLPETELSSERMIREVQLLEQAGTGDSSNALTCTLAHLLLDKAAAETVRAEVAPLFEKDTVPLWKDLEKLPYLSAAIKEGLRLSIGAMARIPRVSPDVELECNGWTIPKNTPVSMSTYYLHMDPSIFPSPTSFNPSRWLLLKSDPALALMQRNYVPFAKGSRNCLGQNVTMAMLHHAIASLFRPGASELSLWETGKEDVMPVHNFIIASPPLESLGVRVRVG